MYTLYKDLRYALRLMLRSPGFTIVAVLTIALGIGANTAIFSLVNAAMIRPLPFSESKRLVSVFHSYTKFNLPRATVSPAYYLYYRDNSRVFENLAAYTGHTAPRNLTGTGEPERIGTVKASWNIFDTLRVRPMLGRTFNAAEDQPGTNRVVVLSYGMWKRRFASDPNIVGRDITLDGANYEVIGVMPESLKYPNGVEAWVPLALKPEERTSGVEYLNVFGRVREGLTPTAAKVDMTRMADELIRRDIPGNEHGWGVVTLPMRAAEVGEIRTVLWVLLAAVGCVLLIACANLANLLLARANARRREIAIRAALGADRWRMVRQMLTEGVLLALIGGLFGLALGYGGLRLMLARMPLSFPSYIEVGIDTNVLVFTLALSVLTGVAFSVVPALRMASSGISDTLKNGGATSVGGRSRVSKAIVIGELAMSLVLLVSAGLLIRTFVSVQQSDFGFRAEQVVTGTISLPEARYEDDASKKQFVRQYLDRLSNRPGIDSVAATSEMPLMANWTTTVVFEGKAQNPLPHVRMATVSEDYFSTLSIPLVRGRVFGRNDADKAPLVAVIDNRTAENYFPGEDPVGKRVAFAPDENEKPEWREIVGVVGAVKHTNPLETETKGQVYFPYQQYPIGQVHVAVRTSADVAGVSGILRRELAAVDPQMPITSLRTMETALNDFVAQPRFNMLLIATFAGLALVLAAVGVYGLIAYSVTQRTQEFGVRMALGAQREDVMKIVLNDGLVMVGIGVVSGLVGSFVVGRMLESMLYGVKPSDPATLMLVSAVLAGIALLASCVPAWRATRVDPVIALRQE